MINGKLDTQFVSGSFTLAEPRNKDYPMNVSYATGSSAIGNTDQDLNSFTWFAYVKDGFITIKRVDLEEEHKIVETGEVSELDFTFDQNANPVFVWVKDGKSYVYRFVSDKYQKVELDEKFHHPRVYIDDPIIANTPKSDVILAYTYDGKLCYALQREKFQKEHVIATDETKTLLWKIGYTTDNRFGFLWR